VAVCAGLAGSAFAAGLQKSVEATSAWVKTPAAGETTATAFVEIDNPTMYDVYLMSATADVAGKVEFRDKAANPQGEVRKTVNVPAFGSIAMEPAGLYMLLTELKRPLKDGDTVALTLTTDGGTMLEVSAPVRKQ
jgi:copper(I)-binding protein